MKTRSLIGWLLLAAALLGGGWWWMQQQAASEAPQFRTAKVERGTLTATVAASGTLAATVQVQVSSQVSGQIREVLADFNSEVRKGEVIARLDPETYEYRVRQAEADVEAARAQVGVQQATVAARRTDVLRATINLDEARRDVDRKTELVARNFISAVERDKAVALYRTIEQELASTRAQVDLAEAQVRNVRATVQQREAQLASARVDLGRTVIRAPVDGVVIKRSIEPGQTVAVSLAAPELFLIAQNLRDMQVEVSIDEAEVSRLRLGQRTSFTVDAFPGRTFEGTVKQVRKASKNEQNVITYTAVVSAENDALSLLPGMTANVRVITDVRQGVLKVPNAALRFRPPGWTDAPKAAVAPGPLRGALEALLPQALAQGSPAPGQQPPAAAGTRPSADARPQPASPPAAGPQGAAAATPGAAQGAAAATPGAAQGGAAATPGAAQGGPGGQLRAFRERLERDLALTDSQRTQLDAIFAGMRERFAAVRDAPEAERAKMSERNRAEMRARIADILDERQKKKYAEILVELSGRTVTRGRVFVPGPEGKPVPVELRLGLSDGLATEVIGTIGDARLAEGDLVYIGVVAVQGTAGPAPAPARPAGPRL
jgi:HlyD family secretion protein